MYPNPESDKGHLAGVNAALTKLKPRDYDVVITWPLRRTYVWAEMSRVRAAFDEIDDELRKQRR